MTDKRGNISSAAEIRNDRGTQVTRQLLGIEISLQTQKRIAGSSSWLIVQRKRGAYHLCWGIVSREVVHPRRGQVVLIVLRQRMDVILVGGQPSIHTKIPGQKPKASQSVDHRSLFHSDSNSGFLHSTVGVPSFQQHYLGQVFPTRGYLYRKTAA